MHNATLTICYSRRIWAYFQMIHWVPLSFSCNIMVPWPDIVMTSARRGSYIRVTQPIQTTKIWQLFETQFSVVWLKNASIHDEICVRFGCLGDDGGSGMLSDTSTRWLLRISIEFPWLLPRYVNFFYVWLRLHAATLKSITKQRPIDYHVYSSDSTNVCLLYHNIVYLLLITDVSCRFLIKMQKQRKMNSGRSSLCKTWCFNFVPGKCAGDGMYYNDDASFVVCTNGNAYVQRCAPGTRNGPYKGMRSAKSCTPRWWCASCIEIAAHRNFRLY